MEHPTYDPQTYVENAIVIRTLNVATPSEKKSFREAERLRLQLLQDDNDLISTNNLLQ